MAVTKGHGNPKWNREETILALDLYFKLDGQAVAPTDMAVPELSKFLRGLPYLSFDCEEELNFPERRRRKV